MASPQRMFGPYQIFERIGSGGMGDVYRAHDSRLGRTVAIKMLRDEINANPAMRARFEREARSVAALNNPHICAVYDVGSEDGIDYLVMEYLEGQTLAERMKDKRVSTDDAILWGIQIAGALDEAHRRGLVHRDIKPGNIILTKAGVKLVDFGLAKEAPLSGRPDLTSNGSLIGTVAYMSPEQVECREVDCRADLFALGVVLYEMLTGMHPFAGSSAAVIISAILTVEPSPVGSVHLDHIVRRCLAKDPAERWQTARDLMLELEWFGGAADIAAPPTVQSQGRRWAQYALLAVLLIAVGWLSMLHFKQKPEAAETRFLISPPEKSIFTSFALSPDGRAIALVTERDGDASLSIRRLDQSQQVRGQHGRQAEAQMDRRQEPRLDGLVGVPDHRLERRDHVADHVFGRIVQQRGQTMRPAEADALPGDGLDQQRMLGDRIDMGAFGLAVPARHPGEPVGDVRHLDVERGWVEEVEPASRQHALPCPRGRAAGSLCIHGSAGGCSKAACR